MADAVARWSRIEERLRPAAEIAVVAVVWNLIATQVELHVGLSGAAKLWWQLALYVLPPLAVCIWRAPAHVRRSLGDADTRFGSHEVLALCVLLLGLAVTAYVVDNQETERRKLAQVRFNNSVQTLEHTLQEQLERPLDALHSLRAMYSVSERLRRIEFGRWVAARNIGQDYPGIVGLGFIKRVMREHLGQFVLNERADDAPDFDVHSSGQADDLFVVTTIEPLLLNRSAWGYDLGSERVRRAALEAALRSGLPSLSGVINLVQSSGKRRGLLLIVPIHDSEADLSTEERRIAATAGFVYAPFEIERVLTQVRPVTEGLLDFELVDTAEDGQPELFSNGERGSVAVDLRLHGQGPERGIHRAEHAMQVGGRTLALHVWSTAEFERLSNQDTPFRLGVAGAVMSALLSLVAWLGATSRQRAQHLAARMTEELREASHLAASAQRENELLLYTMNQHCIVSMTDEQGTITYVNDSFCDISGYAQHELIGIRHNVINSGTHPPEFWTDFWSTLQSGEVWRGELCNRSKTGELYWVKSTIVPFRGEDGQIERFVAVRTNVTAEREIRTQLQMTHQRFSIALEGGNDGLWEWSDVHGQMMWWSPQMYRLLGAEPGELESSIAVFDSLLHPDDQRRTFDALASALRDRTPYDVEFRLRMRSGAYRWFHSRGKVFRDDQGEHQRMAGSLQDIDELKVVQADLRTRNAQMQAVFAVSPDAYVAFDREGRANFVSPAIDRLTDLPAAELIGLRVEELLSRIWSQAPPDARGEAGLQALRSHGQAVDIARTPKRTLWLELHAASPFSEISELMHLRDITQQLEVERMKSDFLSTAAHELRTPMASIFGFTEILMTRDLPVERRQQFLAKIHRQSRAMMSILNELLDLARIEARRGADFEFEVLELGELVREAAHDFPPPAGRDMPTLDLRVKPALVRADRAKLLQTLRNLISNAYKYSPDGGEVLLRLEQEVTPPNGWLRLEVKDHGMGLTPEQMERVTERFYRADTSGAIPGTGLGMSIVKEIVELHGGRLSLSSEVGVGTSVMVHLPEAASPVDTGESTPAGPAEAPH